MALALALSNFNYMLSLLKLHFRTLRSIPDDERSSILHKWSQFDLMSILNSQ
jgi:hypothetical protein